MKNKKVVVFIAVTLILQFVYLVYRLFYTLPFKYGSLALLLGIVLFLAEASSNLQGIFDFFTYGIKKRTDRPILSKAYYPEIDLLILTHNEQTDLLYKTVNACQMLKYPDKNKVHIYLCDDTQREEMRKLAEDFDIHYIGLADEENEDNKAGNINNALKYSHSPLIVTLDADMIPKSNFLVETVPYFYETSDQTIEDFDKQLRETDYDYELAYLQVPQDFYSFDLFQYNLFSENKLPNEQHYFFKNVNEARGSFNSALYCGSNAIVSRQALKKVGGVATDSITEDFSTSIKIQKEGYKAKAISESYVYGLCPFTIEGLKKQRVRWARGFIQGMRSNNIFRSQLSLISKLSYLNLYNYWVFALRRMVFIFVPILATIFNIKVLDINAAIFLLIWVPSYLTYNKALFWSSRGNVNRIFSNITDTILTPYIFAPFLKEISGVREEDFSVTAKSFTGNEAHTKRYYYFHLITLLLSILGIVVVLVNVYNIPLVGQVIFIYWLSWNIFNGFFAMSFNKSREKTKLDIIKWTLKLEGTILDNQGITSAITTDFLNEDYIHIYKPEKELVVGETYQLILKEEAKQAKITTILEEETEDFYLLRVNEKTTGINHDYNLFLNLLHDRDTTHTTEVLGYSGWLSCFKKNARNILRIDQKQCGQRNEKVAEVE